MHNLASDTAWPCRCGWRRGAKGWPAGPLAAYCNRHMINQLQGEDEGRRQLDAGCSDAEPREGQITASPFPSPRQHPCFSLMIG